MNELRKRAVRVSWSRSANVTSCEFAMSSSNSCSCRRASCSSYIQSMSSLWSRRLRISMFIVPIAVI